MNMAKGLVFGMYSQLILLMEISAMVIMVKWFRDPIHPAQSSPTFRLECSNLLEAVQ